MFISYSYIRYCVLYMDIFVYILYTNVSLRGRERETKGETKGEKERETKRETKREREREKKKVVHSCVRVT